MKLRSYIVELMKDQKNGIFASMAKALLSAASFFYGLGISIVAWGYRTGRRRTYAVPIPVISVGNLTVGGTGKTPFAMFLADHFTAKGLKSAILTRGYGNDENVMMRDELPEVRVITGRDRLKSALEAVSFGMDVAIMDDGFQHRRLERDLDILLLDAGSGLGNGRLLPRGILRERAEAIGRAHIIVVTKADTLDKNKKNTIGGILARYAPGKPVVYVRHRPVRVSDVTNAVYGIESVAGKKVVLVSGIADPEYFRSMVETMGAQVVGEKVYPDHHRYCQADILEISRRARVNNADMIMMTRKDLVKVRNFEVSCIEDKLFVLDIVVDVGEGKERLIAGLDSLFNVKRA